MSYTSPSQGFGIDCHKVAGTEKIGSMSFAVCIVLLPNFVNYIAQDAGLLSPFLCKLQLMLNQICDKGGPLSSYTEVLWGRWDIYQFYLGFNFNFPPEMKCSIHYYFGFSVYRKNHCCITRAVHCIILFQQFTVLLMGFTVVALHAHIIHLFDIKQRACKEMDLLKQSTRLEYMSVCACERLCIRAWVCA